MSEKRFKDGGATLFLFLISFFGICEVHGLKNALLFIPIWIMFSN